MTGVRWYTNATAGDAVRAAEAAGRPLLVDFWSPTCKGCAKLVAVSYADEEVRRFLSDSFVCVKYNTKEPNEWFRQLNGRVAHLWHPDLVVLDERLTEVRRVIGYLPPDELVAQLAVGLGLVHLHRGRPAAALALFERVAGEDGHTGAAPEALYWAGVAAYRAGGGLAALEPRWRAIRERHPGSDWVWRADCLDVAIPPGGFDAADPGSVELVVGV